MPSRANALSIGGLLGLALAAPAQAEELNGAQIRNRIGGELVRLSTPYGIALPLRYRNDGVVAGDLSGFSIGGMLAPREEGRWWVKGDTLCQKWPTWYDGRTYCFTITSLGPNKIAWKRDDGLSGTAVMGH